jgi:hypothetical protein
MCQRCFELIGCFTVVTVVGVGALWAHSSIINANRAYDEVERQMSNKTFSISCSETGAIVETGTQGNCFESNGYRVIRDGIKTTIIKVTKNEPGKLIYRSGYSDGVIASGREMMAVATALGGA